jgi:hypothetical protein
MTRSYRKKKVRKGVDNYDPVKRCSVKTDVQKKKF